MEEIENDASNAIGAGYMFIATTATLDGQEYELFMQGQRVESERNKERNLVVLKATSRNATKRVILQVITKVGKSAEVVLQQFTTQKL